MPPISVIQGRVSRVRERTDLIETGSGNDRSVSLLKTTQCFIDGRPALIRRELDVDVDDVVTASGFQGSVSFEMLVMRNETAGTISMISRRVVRSRTIAGLVSAFIFTFFTGRLLGYSIGDTIGLYTGLGFLAAGAWNGRKWLQIIEAEKAVLATPRLTT